MRYRVIIVEDDPMVAAIDRQYVESDPAFRVERVFKTGADALAYLSAARADLIILDYYTPGMMGREFMDRLHAMDLHVAVIAVTSASEAEIVQGLLARGVLDYLVKPFAQKRFTQALEKFRRRMETLGGAQESLDQQAIDRLVGQAGAPAAADEQLAKGLNPATLELVRGFFRESGAGSFTSEQVAAQIHLSRITVRRYVNYMMAAGELTSTIDYQTGGRPSIHYRRAKLK